MTPVQLLADQAVAAATCALIPLDSLCDAAGDDLEAWLKSEFQDNLTSFQRQELMRMVALWHGLAVKLRGEL